MPRYKLTLEYCGTDLLGWQRQPQGPSVQCLLEEAFAALTGMSLLVQGAGRTDAGVHATGQTAHVDLPRPYPPHKICGAVNYHLRAARIAVLAAEPVPDDFHARLDARKRRYLYRILNRRAPPALDRGRVWSVPVALNAEAMDRAASHLLGHHDFTSFRASECQALSPLKTLDRLEVRRLGEEIQILAEARSFLHHQVRNMVGTLKLVGTGHWPASRVAEALAARDRSAAGPTAPPDGLYLIGVEYSGIAEGAGDLAEPGIEDEVE